VNVRSLCYAAYNEPSTPRFISKIRCQRQPDSSFCSRNYAGLTNTEAAVLLFLGWQQSEGVLIKSLALFLEKVVSCASQSTASPTC
jgi:hypothetical protein